MVNTSSAGGAVTGQPNTAVVIVWYVPSSLSPITPPTAPNGTLIMITSANSHDSNNAAISRYVTNKASTMTQRKDSQVCRNLSAVPLRVIV